MLGNKGSRKVYREGGARGGANQFNWDDVKSDRDRQNYLGHSVNAPVGRWQRGRDILWYAKEKNAVEAMQDEKDRLRELDEEVMNAALGIKTTKKRSFESTLTSEDTKRLLAKNEIDRSELNIERVQGLGAAPVKVHEHIERKSYIEKEIEKLKSGISTETTAIPINSLPGSFDEGENEKKNKKHKKDKKEKKEKKEKKHKKHNERRKNTERRRSRSFS